MELVRGFNFLKGGQFFSFHLELAALRVVKRASSLANLGMGAGFVRFAKVLDLVRRVLEGDT